MRKGAVLGPSIDITEFERRLRGQQPAKASGRDLLEELAWLLHGNEGAAPADPSHEVFAEQAPHRAPSTPPATPTLQATEPPYYHEDDAFESELRGSFDDATSAAAPAQQPYHEAAFQQEAAYHDQNADWSLDESDAYLDFGAQEREEYAAQDEREGGRRFLKLWPWRALVSIAALGIASVGWTFAHRSSSNVTPQEVATTARSGGSAKALPDSSEAPRLEQNVAVLDRNESAPVRNVETGEEQPIDPPVAPKTLPLGAAPLDAAHEPGGGLVLEPRKVKTVSVRPNASGSDNDSAPGVITERVPLNDATALPVNDAQANASADSASTATPKSPPKTAQAPRAAQPTRRRPEKVAVAPENPDINDNHTPAITATSGSSGTFEVQFGEAASEAEARQLMQHIAGKFSSQFGGHHLSYRHAKVDDKKVYQVRLRNLGEESAVGICEKLKSAGRNCFVTGN